MRGVPYIADPSSGDLPLQNETAALLARMTAAPNAARRDLLNRTIYALKQAGVWAQLVSLAVHAAHDEQTALLDWKAAANNPAKTGTLTFTADRGYTAGWSNLNYLKYPLTTAGDFGGADVSSCWIMAAGDYDVAAINAAISGAAAYAIVSSVSYGFTGDDGLVNYIRDTASGFYSLSIGNASVGSVLRGTSGGSAVGGTVVLAGRPSVLASHFVGGSAAGPLPLPAPDTINTPRTAPVDIGDHMAFGSMASTATNAHARALTRILTDYLSEIGAL